MDFQRLGGYPLAILIVTSVLRDFTNIDFRIEVRCKCLMMITCVAIYDIQILHFIEIMFGSICSINTTYPRIEAATKDGGQSGILKTFLICPLPAVFKVSHIFRLIVGSVQIVDSAFKTSFHNGKILIGKCYVYDDFGFEAIKESNQFIHIVGIYLCGLDVRVTDCFYDSVAFGLCAAGNHDLSEYIRILSHLVRNDGTYTACTDNKNFTHFF